MSPQALPSHFPRRYIYEFCVGFLRTEQAIKNLFERYEIFFRKSLASSVDKNELADLYASELIAASPAGVMIGKNDEKLMEAMS